MKNGQSKIIKYFFYILISVALSYLGSHAFFEVYTTDPLAPPLEYILDDAIFMSWALGIFLFCFSVVTCLLFDTFLLQKLLDKLK